VKVKYWINTDKVGSKCQDVIEIDDAEWLSMNDQERDELMKDQAFQHLDWGYEVVEQPETTEAFGRTPE
jgi:hypothetical protein